MARARNGKPEYMKLEQRLVLLAWLNGLFGYESNRDLLADLQEAGESFDADGRSHVAKRLESLSVENLSHRYLWNPAAVDQLMADEHITDPAAAGDVLWPLADHLGTIRDLAAYDPATDTTTVVNHRTFDAYGNVLSQTNPAHDTLFAFTARPLDHETGLQNNLHRWYDAKTGRWMSEDPIGFEGRGGNLGRYVGNSVVNASDPNGLMAPPFGVIAAPTRFRVRHDPYEQSFVLVHVAVPTGYFSLSISIEYRDRVHGGLTPQSRTVMDISVDFVPTDEDYTDKLLKFAIVENRVPPTQNIHILRREKLVTESGKRGHH